MRSFLALAGCAFLAAACSGTSNGNNGLGNVGGSQIGTTGAGDGGTRVGPSDGGMTCPDGQKPCGGRCTDPDVDPLNCGGCAGTDAGAGQACLPGEICSGGECSETCAPGYTTCTPDAGPDGGFDASFLDAGEDAGLVYTGPYCANLLRDTNNCGACGEPCPPGQRCDGTGKCAADAVDAGIAPVANIVLYGQPANPFLGVNYHASYNVNTVNTFTFQAVDSTGKVGVPDIAVRFSAGQSNPVDSQILVTSGTTNSNGLVTTQVESGQKAGPIAVIATIVLPDGTSLSATGNSAVIGTQPSVSHSGISCSPVNLPAYTDGQEPCGTNSSVSSQTTCTVTLADRFGNAIQVPVPVQFFSEAGNWQNASVSTPAYGASGATPGQATNALQVSGGPLPQDVDPLPADGLLAAEPYYSGICAGGPRTFNPRDGLVNVIAVFQGEEPFEDLTGSGYWEPNDPFVDLPQPFVDNDDSSQYKPGDICPGLSNGSCAGPNHIWDGSANVWVQTHILYSGDPIFTGWTPDAGVIVPVNGPLQGTVTWSDENLNTSACGGGTSCETSYAVTLASGTTNVQVQFPANGLPASPGDTLGMIVTQVEDCDAGYVLLDGGQHPNPVCSYRTVVHGFSGGFTGTYNASEAGSACSGQTGGPCADTVCLEAPAHFGSDQPPLHPTQACFVAE